MSELELSAFRCWDELKVAFPSGRCALIGGNATGKTSIVEAAWYAATLGSHRAPDPALVGRGRESAAVRAHVTRDGREQIVELEVRSKGVSRAQIGGAPVRRRREILGVLRAALFAPERVAVVRGDPSERRTFTDEMVMQLAPRLYGVMRDYDRALRQRNALLRDAGGRTPAGLEAWDASIVGPGSELCAARAEAVSSFAPHAGQAWDAVAGEGQISIAYTPNIPAPADPFDPSGWAESMIQRLAERRADEIARGSTLVGPHRDDLALAVDGLPSRTHASQGEAWLIALALVLGARSTIAARTGEEPVLLLDDALEPLDPARRERVAEILPADAQTIITAADPNAVPESLGAQIFHVSRGRIDG